MKYLLLEYYYARCVKTVSGDADRMRYKHFLYPKRLPFVSVDKHKSSYSFPYSEEGDFTSFGAISYNANYLR